VARNRVTLQTLADRLGVSRTTVSNAYNRPDQLAPELRERILATAAELGYTGPDPAARRLRSGGREAVGLLFTEALPYAFDDPPAILFLQGFSRAVEEAGLPLLILPSLRDREGGAEPVRDAVVGGFCLYSLPENSPGVVAAIERRLPIVVVDEPRSPGLSFVGIDDRGGARMAAEHLTRLGHRRIGIVSFRTVDDGYAGPLTPEREAGAAGAYTVTRDRLAGWRDGIEAAGLDWADMPKQEVVLNSVEEGAGGMRAVLERDPSITAVLCSSDQLALGALKAAPEAGRVVPWDLSVVGFDDTPTAARAQPPLTTVRQPLLEKGLTAGRLLVDDAGPEPREVILPVELVVRGSTARPA
jgi:DNA-binding LacI/PurR family transcriptional regulator